MASNEQPQAVPSPGNQIDIEKIFNQLLAEEHRYAPLVIQTDKWLIDNAEKVEDHPKAWLASKVLTYAETEISHGALPAQSEEWTEHFFESPVATQVSVSLNRFCGYSPEEVGELTNRSVDQVAAMLDSIEPSSQIESQIPSRPDSIQRAEPALAFEPDFEPDSEPEPEPEPETQPESGGLAFEPGLDTSVDSDTSPATFGTPMPEDDATAELPGLFSSQGTTAGAPLAPALFGTPRESDPVQSPLFGSTPAGNDQPKIDAPPGFSEPDAGNDTTGDMGIDAGDNDLFGKGAFNDSTFGDSTVGTDYGESGSSHYTDDSGEADGGDALVGSNMPDWAEDLEPEPVQKPSLLKSIPKALWFSVAAVLVAIALIGLYLYLGPDDTSAQSNPGTTGTAGVTGPVTTEPVRSALSEACALQTRGDGALGKDVALDFGDGKRQFRLTVVGPDAPSPKGLVIWLPDMGEDPIQSVKSAGLEPIGQELDYIIATIYPADSPGQWNVTGDENSPNDVRMIDEVIDYVVSEYCVDASRIVMGGLGSGAHLAASAACAEQNHPVALLLFGGIYEPDTCETLPRSIQVVYGTDDEFFRVDGTTGDLYEAAVSSVGELGPGSEYEIDPVQDAFGAWAVRQQCAEAANASAEQITRTTHQNCAYSGTVNLAVVDGGEHEWIHEADPLVKGFINSLAIK